MPILNYTTTVDCHKTISEISKLLMSRGATKIIVDNENLQPVSISFCIDWSGSIVAFKMPCNFNGVLSSMKKSKSIAKSKCTREQALRVGWRILKDWIAAQMAIVEAEMATMAEVFLPYAITKEGETMYEKISNHKQMLLTN